MSAVLPHLVAKVDEEFRKGNLTEAHAAQDTLNKWWVTLCLLHCLCTSVVDAIHSLHSADDPSHTLYAIASLPGLQYESPQPAVCKPEHARSSSSLCSILVSSGHYVPAGLLQETA